MSDQITITRVYSADSDFSNAMNVAKDKTVTRLLMASFYADCIQARISPEQVSALNHAILARWPKGLKFIKEKAWGEVNTGKPAFLKSEK